MEGGMRDKQRRGCVEANALRDDAVGKFGAEGGETRKRESATQTRPQSFFFVLYTFVYNPSTSTSHPISL
jgi:hypothetical protein